MQTHDILYSLAQDISNFSDILQTVASEDKRPEVCYCAGIAFMIRKNAIDYFLGYEEEDTLQSLSTSFILNQYSQSKDRFLQDLSIRAKQFSEHISEIQMEVSRQNNGTQSLLGVTDSMRLGFVTSDWDLLVNIMDKHFNQSKH